MRMGRRGLTLADTMLALFVLMAAYLPLAQLYQITTAQTVKSRNFLVAQHLAKGLFELYRMRSSFVLKPLQGQGTLSSADILQDAQVRAVVTGHASEIEDVLKFGSFKMKVEVTLADPALIDLHRVDATVIWQESGQERSHRFARLVCQ